MDAYNDRLIFKLFNQIFENMPVAAIVNSKLVFITVVWEPLKATILLR